jgi:outer membrane lipoprotein-sorting protein
LRTVVCDLLLVASTVCTSAIAADSDAVLLVEGVTRKARQITSWEAQGSLTGDDPSKRETSFRVVLERPVGGSPPARARLEIRSGDNPSVHVCDGQSQWTYRLMPRQYWKLALPEIDACTYPFTEWTTLSAHLRSATITGVENLKLGQRRIDCTVVRADFFVHESTITGSRTLWIDEATKMIWRYRIEPNGGASGPDVQLCVAVSG